MKKTKIKKGMVLGIVIIFALIIIGLGVNQLLNYVGIKGAEAREFIENPVKIEFIGDITIPDKKDIVEPTMKEWIKTEVENAGLNWNEVDCLIQNESGWDNWKYGINTNGSTDFGLWQINSIHKETVSVECRWDYKCSTYWAIQKRLNQGHWEAWYGYKHNCK